MDAQKLCGVKHLQMQAFAAFVICHIVIFLLDIFSVHLVTTVEESDLMLRYIPTAFQHDFCYSATVLLKDHR